MRMEAGLHIKTAAAANPGQNKYWFSRCGISFLAMPNINHMDIHCSNKFNTVMESTENGKPSTLQKAQANTKAKGGYDT